MQITKDIRYIGISDSEPVLFEAQFESPNGMAYNSYLIKDEKIAILDTVDAKYGTTWLNNIKSELRGATPDYLVIHHMEPDHSSSILLFMNEFPSATVVSSDKAFDLMNQFYKNSFEGSRRVVREGDMLCLGKHTLTFYAAPMVHWPEVIVSYDTYDGVLFSADAFGRFGAAESNANWQNESRRYYFGIVGKYGAQVQRLLKKLSNLKINIICSLHGNVISQNIDQYMSLYDTWSKYEPEEKGAFIAYASVYGNTKEAADYLANAISSNGVNVSKIDLSRDDIYSAVAQAFKYSHLVIASTTYNNGIFPSAKEFISHLADRDFQKRTVAIIENGSWAPSAANKMRLALKECKNLNIIEKTVTICSAMSKENKQELNFLARELCK